MHPTASAGIGAGAAAIALFTVELRQPAAAVSPVTPEAHGQQPATHNGHVNRLNGHSTAAMSKAVNGHNGHDLLNGRATILNGSGPGAGSQYINQEN